MTIQGAGPHPLLLPDLLLLPLLLLLLLLLLPLDLQLLPLR